MIGLGLFLIFTVIQGVSRKEEFVNAPDYTQFVNDVKSKNITEVYIRENENGTRTLNVRAKSGETYKVLAPRDQNLIQDLVQNQVKVKTIGDDQPDFFTKFFYSWGPTLVIVALLIWMTKKNMGGKGNPFSFGKSRATKVKTNVKFDDVVGCDEAKEEVKEVVDFLKSPDKFSKLGGKIPRGVLLTGPAGTGKTMLAKAIAHEANVPFFHTSGSSFVEMFVGVGAARVRDMFEAAKKEAPCILFIDEIDAMGGKRTGGGAGNDEREQTLNQLLVEMDGIETNNGVIIVAATNRPDMLDPALLRPGRLDRQVVVGLPDVKGREQILKVHSRNVPIAYHVDLSKIARGTPGFSGAELANLVNESALFAARKGRKFVEQDDFENAKDKIVMGPERRSMVMPEIEKKNTAYHESGHAVVAKLLKNSDPVHKVTIIPRGRALGVTMQLPENDKYSHDQHYLLDRIAVLMGGRIAEELFCAHMTNGASNDIEVATDIAKKMVTRWGMSDLGPIAYGEENNNGFLGGSMNMNSLSQETLREVDLEIRKIVKEQYQIAKDLLDKNRDKVEAMTQALIEVETIDDWQIENIMQGVHYNAKIASPSVVKDDGEGGGSVEESKEPNVEDLFKPQA
jgi:cell division protease FtsH